MTARGYQPGELVDVMIRAGRVVQHSSGTVHVEVERGAGTATVGIPLVAPGVTVQRLAPACWPPTRGQIWCDAAGMEWFARERGRHHTIELVPMADDLDGDGLPPTVSPEFLLRDYGPVRRIHPPMPTDAPEPMSEGATVDRRAATIGGLRELATLLEVNPDLPINRYAGGEVTIPVRQLPNVNCDEDGFDELRRIAGILGVEPEVRDEAGVRHPDVELVLTGGVTYRAFYVTDARQHGYKPTEPAVGEAPSTSDTAEVPS